MNIRSHTRTYAIAMFLISVAVSVYTSWFHSLPLLKWLLGGLLNGLLLASVGAMCYQYSVQFVGSTPSNKMVIFNALFAYFLAYQFANLFNLFAVSWLIFLALVGVASFVTGWRLSMNKKQKSANKFLNQDAL
ncbi:hypothetical protein [Thiobacillus sp.]|uniref:hypothetical protein n=1 Tax=Thiobacillus sp. TaxID=924 RepID=UPI0011D4EDFB|nr:hypothetical protein [Thiobacillus sp.]TXH75617.1 MAG: hypothetical protein E6Q82_06000 [Thiobacillus sp.]